MDLLFKLIISLKFIVFMRFHNKLKIIVMTRNFYLTLRGEIYKNGI